MPHKRHFFLVAVALQVMLIAVSLPASATASVMISEVADKGSLGACGGNDWLELFNNGTTTVDLSDGWALYDSNGIESENTFVFPKSTTNIAPQEMLLLCCNAAINTNSLSPQFKIGTGDVITLVKVNSLTQFDFGVNTSRVTKLTNTNVQSQIEVPSKNNGFGVTYAWNAATDSYEQTSTPTPGEPNILTKVQDMTDKERLAAQNALGTPFFGMHDNGYPVANDTAMDTVLDLHVTMEDADYEYLIQNQSYEVYRPFLSISVKQKDGQELQSLSGLDSNNKMRIRTKGRGSLAAATCMGFPAVPFQIDLDSSNVAQTLFGVTKFYLRNHMSDFSYMRDWGTNVMLARFGLPYLRTRKVRFYVNGHYKGLYEFMEAADQEYVFARNFPTYNPDKYALFKFKMLSRDCGKYND